MRDIEKYAKDYSEEGLTARLFRKVLKNIQAVITITAFIQITAAFTVLNTLQKFFRFLILFL